MSGLHVEQAARELGIATSTLRRWCRRGCPVVARGGRGRGNAMLVDVAAARAWRGASVDQHAVQAIASAIPELLASATFEVWRQSDIPNKRRLARIMAALWDVGNSTVLDYICEQTPEAERATETPEAIKRLLKVAMNE